MKNNSYGFPQIENYKIHIYGRGLDVEFDIERIDDFKLINKLMRKIKKVIVNKLNEGKE